MIRWAFGPALFALGWAAARLLDRVRHELTPQQEWSRSQEAWRRVTRRRTP